MAIRLYLRELDHGQTDGQTKRINAFHECWKVLKTKQNQINLKIPCFGAFIIEKIDFHLMSY